MKRIIAGAILLLILIPIVSLTETALGTKEMPVKQNQPFTTEYETMSYGDYEDVSGDITITVVGQLVGGKAIDKIYEYSFVQHQGPKYFCFKLLVSAENLSRNVSIPITAGAFKAFDTNFLKSEILTEISYVELLNETKAYLYLGFRTPEDFPGYLVFDDSVWFDLTNVPFVEE